MFRIKLKSTLVLICLLIGLAASFGIGTFVNAQTPQRQPATVVNIVDGDTLDVTMGGHKQRLRLTCIDTPEQGQSPFYEDAKKRLAELAPVGTTLSVRDTDQDRSHGRVVAEIYRNNSESINVLLIREGKARIYCKYLSNCAGSKDSYLSAERAAQSQGLGIWNPNNPWTGSRESQACSLQSSAPPRIPVTPPQPSPPYSPAPSTASKPTRSPQSGKCNCPYDLRNDGRQCGGNSAYSRPGGQRPACYIGE